MHWLGVARPGRTENGLLCILSADDYRVLKSFGASATAITPHDIAVITSSGFNNIAPANLPLG